jgi:hypothetical protein
VLRRQGFNERGAGSPLVEVGLMCGNPLLDMMDVRFCAGQVLSQYRHQAHVQSLVDAEPIKVQYPWLLRYLVLDLRNAALRLLQLLFPKVHSTPRFRP